MITDARILNAICIRYNMKFDKKYKYITEDNNISWFDYKGSLYKLKYFDGCFHPYVIKINK